jgi:hypothetical protein
MMEMCLSQKMDERGKKGKKEERKKRNRNISLSLWV